jgi:hypothetical protein
MYNQASHVITYDMYNIWNIWMIYMKHVLHEWNITYATYERSLMPHMKHYLCNIWNITFATFKMQFTCSCSWMNGWCLCSWNASAKCKLNTRVLQPPLVSLILLNPCCYRLPYPCPLSSRSSKYNSWSSSTRLLCEMNSGAMGRVDSLGLRIAWVC